ncbi:MAG: D-alanyl-D-alanine carboxypeptidase/D-alanyl-D-alanine-endopeptidase [Burkholderiaceae bacterium]
MAAAIRRLIALIIACLAFAAQAVDRGGQVLPAPGAADAMGSDVRPGSAWSALDASLSAWLAANGLARAAVGLEIRDALTGEVLAGRNAGRPINPASLMKLLPVTASLQTLGPHFVWRTGWYLDGPLAGGRLAGDLLMVGDGDPKLVIEDLTELIAQMRARGLQRIDGDLLIDDALFSLPPPGPPFDGQPNEPYNVAPSAGLLNFKSTKFVFTPRGSGVALELDPPLAGIAIRNRMRLEGGRCRHGPADARFAQRGNDEVPEIVVSGRYSRACGRRSAYFAVLDHRQFAEAFFRAAWEGAGGIWNGHAHYRSGALSRLPPERRRQPWLVWQSPRDLDSIATDINKFSNNVMARMLMLRLGVAIAGPQATESVAREAVLARLAQWGLDVSAVVMENGAGLSRRARLRPSLLGELLVRALADPNTRGLRETLPVLGVDGTMRWRLTDRPVAGNAWIKTGSLEDVRSIAGYLRARSGRLYTVVLIVNDARARAALGVQDRLLEWLYDAG